MEELIKVRESRDEDELVRELFDELSPLFMQPYHMESNSMFSPDPHILSPPYSGPTVEEIETALSYSNYGFGHGDYMSEAERLVIFDNSIILRFWLSL